MTRQGRTIGVACCPFRFMCDHVNGCSVLDMPKDWEVLQQGKQKELSLATELVLTTTENIQQCLTRRQLQETHFKRYICCAFSTTARHDTAL
jgi:hypothetical protein